MCLALGLVSSMALREEIHRYQMAPELVEVASQPCRSANSGKAVVVRIQLPLHCRSF